MTTPRAIHALLACLALAAGAARAQVGVGSMPKPDADASGAMQRELERGVDVEEHLNKLLPLDTTFTNSEGKEVPLSAYFKPDGKPAIILMVYYRCPVVCDVLMDKLAETLQKVDYTAGKDFRILVFSFDPNETPDAAAKARQLYISGYNRELTPEQRAGWEFHVGDAASIRQLANALGFEYKPVPGNEYSHPVITFMASPDGRVVRYLYGFQQTPSDMRMAILEASEGKLAASLGDRLMNFCYVYNPDRRSYTLAAFRVMQIGGVICIVLVGSLVGGLLIRESLRKSRAAAAAKLGTNPPAPTAPEARASTT
ncbi:MAG TPA: SCO family protein [Phycisphaerales bacterium]|nr:SCO family protein [Phycisphaerales bacterium]